MDIPVYRQVFPVQYKICQKLILRGAKGEKLIKKKEILSSKSSRLTPSAPSASKLLVKQEDGSWKGQAIYGFPATMTKTGSYYYLKLDDDRTEYIFDLEGKLTKAKDGLGNELEFTYNESDQLTRIDSNSTIDSSDIDDRYLTFTYTSDRCTKITASDGRELHFTYDENDPDRLTYIKYKKSSGGTLYTKFQFVYGTDAEAFYAIEEVKTNRADGTFGTLFSYTYNYDPQHQDCTSLVTGKKDADGDYIYEVSYIRGSDLSLLILEITGLE